MKKKIPTPINASAAKPPTTPPTIGATFVDFLEDRWLFASDELVGDACVVTVL